MRYGKILYQLRTITEKTFSDCHPSFSLVKAAMNAPHICKLGKDYLTGIGHGLHFFILQLPKAEERPLRTCKVRKG
jgi:hypothetical protein